MSRTLTGANSGRIVYPPSDMPYGVREYGVRDSEDGMWLFMQRIDGP